MSRARLTIRSGRRVRAALVALTGLCGIVEAPPLAAAGSAWNYSASVDRLTDERVSRAWTGSISATLSVRCRAGLIELYVVKSGYIANQGGSVTYRIDRDTSVDALWSSSTSSTGLFADDAVGLARALRSGVSLLLEVRDFQGTPSRSSFSLTGASAAIGRVLTDCGVMVTDPRASNDGIWRRVIQDIDDMPRRDVLALQTILNTLSPAKLNVSGIRDLATYRAASLLFDAYWNDCAAGKLATGRCGDWRARNDNTARYPGTLIDILGDWIKEIENGTYGNHPPPPDPAIPVPKGRPESWITADDYPSAAITKKSEGTTVVAYEVGPTGTIRNCRVQSSSSAPELDDTTCQLLLRRARYTPAKDKDGNAITVQARYTMRWTLPK